MAGRAMPRPALSTRIFAPKKHIAKTGTAGYNTCYECAPGPQAPPPLGPIHYILLHILLRARRAAWVREARFPHRAEGLHILRAARRNGTHGTTDEQEKRDGPPSAPPGRGEGLPAAGGGIPLRRAEAAAGGAAARGRPGHGTLGHGAGAGTAGGGPVRGAPGDFGLCVPDEAPGGGPVHGEASRLAGGRAGADAGAGDRAGPGQPGHHSPHGQRPGAGSGDPHRGLCRPLPAQVRPGRHGRAVPPAHAGAGAGGTASISASPGAAALRRGPGSGGAGHPAPGFTKLRRGHRQRGPGPQPGAAGPLRRGAHHPHAPGLRVAAVAAAIVMWELQRDRLG